ncbi:MAG: DUF481 domain-containing protein [Bdellovibrionota bacterium]
MKRTLRFFAIVACLLFSPSAGLAQETPAPEASPPEAPAATPVETPPEPELPEKPPPPPPRNWKASAELGLTLSTGNTKSKSINSAVKGEVTEGDLTFKAGGTALFTRSTVVIDPGPPVVEAKRTTARKFTADGRTDWSISKHQYLFILGTYLNDKLGGAEWEVTESAGYGFKVIDEEKLKLKLEAGPAGRHSEPARGTAQEEEKHDIAGRGAMALEWVISQYATFNEDASVVASEEEPNTPSGVVVESISALKAKVSDKLSMKATFTYRHQSEVAAGKKEDDTTTAVTFVYDF